MAFLIAEGVGVAFPNEIYEDEQTFTRIDDPDGLNHVEEITIDRGRESILNRCEAGTAGFTLQNNDGTWDTTNPSSPFYGLILPLRQVQIVPKHPYTGEFIPVFSGFIDEWKFSRNGRALSDAEVTCFDGFEPLSNAQVVPDSSRAAAAVFYASQRVNDRLIALLADAGWPAELTDIFEGNVNLQETTYSPGTAFLTALFDAADAEFPGVSNLYVARDGTFRFRGRYDRFNYADYDTDHIGPTLEWPRRQGRQYWYLGDGDAVESDPTLVPIFNMNWNFGKASIINTALVTPQGVKDTEIPGQRVLDATSRNSYGERALNIPNLIVLDHPSDGTNAVQECHRYGEYYVDNWKQPLIELESIEIHGHMAELRPERSFIWTFCMEVEIGDICYVTTTNPGGGGMTARGFFVEGIHHVISSLSDRFPRWVTKLDLSPLEAFTSFPAAP